MKRITMVLLTILMVVALAVPTLAITISPEDYIVEETSNGDISTLYVTVPGEDLRIKWNLLNGSTYATIKEEEAQAFTVTLTASPSKYWVGCQVFDYLDITDIVDGSTLSVKYNIEYELATYQPLVGSIRYQIRYFDADGIMLDSVKFVTVPSANFFDETALDVTIDKPEGAVKMTFILQFMDITTEQTPITFRLNLESVSFVCDIPTMVRVQQETGRTNKLLEDIIEYKPTPKPPEFQEGLEGVEGREDAIVGEFEDGTLENFGGNIVDASEYLGQFASTFTLVQHMWEPFIQMPWLNAILVCSLALGLLGGFLGIFVTTARSDSKGRGDD